MAKTEATTKTYICKEPINHDGDDHAVGAEIVLTDKHAKPLFAVGAIELPAKAGAVEQNDGDDEADATAAAEAAQKAEADAAKKAAADAAKAAASKPASKTAAARK